jgi:pimeloyl-ACP methyl ester carboxylesterase
MILIEPPIFMKPWIVKEIESQIANLVSKMPHRSEELIEEIVFKLSSADRKLALEVFAQTSREVRVSIYRNLLLWDKIYKKSCEVPSLLIQASRSFCDEENLHTLLLNLNVGRVVGAGPWANLEVPDQVHAMIERYLELS